MEIAVEPVQIGQALQELALPSDFVDYVQRIWLQGASDEAYSSLMGVAHILVGNSILTFPYDQERLQYVNRYEGTSCPRPGLSRAELDQYYAEWKARCDAVYPRLRRFADTDDSGFVTADEGQDVRSSFEGGLKVASLSSVEGDDLDKLAGLVPMNRRDCEKRLIRYLAILELFPEYIGTSLLPLPEAIKAQLPEPASKVPL